MSLELHDGAVDGYEDAVIDSSSDGDSDIPLVKIIHGSQATPIFSSVSDIPLAKITHGSRATPIFSPDSDIPLAKITHGIRATPIPISNRKRPTLAKLATAGGNLFLCICDSYFNPFKEAVDDSSNHTVTLENGDILAGKRKSSPPQKSSRANAQNKTTSGKLNGGNPFLIQINTNHYLDS